MATAAPQSTTGAESDVKHQPEGGDTAMTEQNSNVEVDDVDDGASDFLESDTASSTASLTSTIMNYKYENGRRYHGFQEGEYMIPNDEREQDRMDVGYHIFKMLLGGELHRAPIPDTVSSLLDLGTGTGAWALEMADKYPSAQVTGIDLSPIQPRWVSPNCTFEIYDFETPQWTFSSSFSYIHARNTEGSVKDHPALFARCFENLKPGGWIEAAEATVGVFCDDDTIKRAGSLVEWQDRLLEASGMFGKQMGVAGRYKGWLEAVGFVGVREEVFKIPFSPWAKDPKLKELGMYQQHLMLEALDAYSFALFTRVLGWEPERIHMLLAGVRKELMDRSLHCYGRIYFVYGQKPGVPGDGEEG